MKTILVTGGVGFIGSSFVRHLHGRYPDYRLLVVDALTYAGNVQNGPNGGNGASRYEFWHGDVRNGELMDTLVSQADVVVHMAAESHVTRSIYDNRLFFETDVLGTQVVANAVVKHRDRVELFVHVSTSEVYGSALTERMNEEHPLNPMSPYASAKCGADRLVYSYWATYGIPTVIVRPFNNYGPCQHLEKAIPRFITSCLLDEPLRVHGDGSAKRDWIFVEEHCEALDRLLHAEVASTCGQVFNVGTGEHKSILEVAEAVLALMRPANGRIEFIGDRPGQVFRHTCDASKIASVVGWKSRLTFMEGLERTVRWYTENEAWWRPQVWMRQIPIITAAGNREMH